MSRLYLTKINDLRRQLTVRLSNLEGNRATSVLPRPCPFLPWPTVGCRVMRQ